MDKDSVLNKLRSQIGTQIHQSDWVTVSQEMINAFADATDDHQWIHIDQEKGFIEFIEQYSVEVENLERPACVAECIMRLYF